MIKSTVSLLFLVFSLQIHSQNIPIGTWRSHFSYHNINKLAKTNWGIFGASDHGIVQLLTDNSMSSLSIVNGLSAAQITCLGGDGEYLFVGHENGEIDIVSENRIINILDLSNSNLVGSKKVNDVARSRDLAYFATDFGIIVIDLLAGSIKENYRSIGKNGSDVSTKELKLLNDDLYVITDEGIQKGSLNRNLLDFTQWEFYQSETEDKFSELTSDGTRLWAIASDTALINIQNNSFDVVHQSENILLQLASDNESLFVQQSSELFLLKNDQLTFFQSVEEYTINDLFVEEGLWIADASLGMITPDGESIILNGPRSDDFKRIRTLKNELFAFYNSTNSPPTAFNGFDVFNGANWVYNTIPQFQSVTDASFLDNKLFLASAQSGVYRVSDSTNLADEEAQFLPSNRNNTFEISSMVSHRNKLWVSSYDNDLPLLAFNGESWSSYSNSEIGTAFPEELKISARELIWIQGSSQNGLLVFNPEDKLNTNINTGDGLPSNSIISFDINNQDEVWIATTSGIGNYPEASLAFDPFQVIVPVFGGQLLFDNTQVTAVASDGGDRLWVATPLGLWLFDSNISTLIHQFNTANSPLPSNNIDQLSYNAANGELFILTDQGLVSFRSSSSAARALYSAVEIFPNPVPPDYSGRVGFKNLLQNSSVKICDINGKLITEITSDGGTASWNLRDLSGARIKTGVYLVFIANFDGSESFVGKVAVVN
ncbi:MAG: T9SS type A sorting domain-containing protein [Cyclobacteriaceae bacterium]